MNQMIAPNRFSASPIPAGARVQFTGENGTFAGMVTRGGLLELVTFGFYRFWLTTAIRRHLWANTRLDGDAPEYLGRPRELLIGFLFAMAIMVPLYVGYFVLQLEASRISQFANIPLFLFILGFLQFAEYRARRYRLTRTVWRGVGFSMTGSGVNYALRAFAWQILVILTLGLAYPWRAAALERYKMANTSYGDLQGSFQATGWTFFKRGIAVWIAFVVLALVVFASAGWIASGLGPHMTKLPGAKVAVLVGTFFVVPLAASFLYPTFQAIQWKWWSEGLRVGDVTVESDLRIGRIIDNSWAMIGAMIGGSLALLFIGGTVVAIIAGAVSIVLTVKHDWATMLGATPYLQTALTLSIYLPFVLVLGIIRRIYMTQRLWKIVAGSMTLSGLDTVDDVLADLRVGRIGALGEGLADGLDLAGF